MTSSKTICHNTSPKVKIAPEYGGRKTTFLLGRAKCYVNGPGCIQLDKSETKSQRSKMGSGWPPETSKFDTGDSSKLGGRKGN